MNIKDIAQSKTLRGIIIGILIFIVVILIFQAGVFVGFRKASFLFRGGDNYYRAFDRGPMGGQGLPFGDVTGAHGAAGKIVRVSLPTIVIADRDNVEKVVLISKDTVIREGRSEVKENNLKIGSFAVVLGSPNDQAQVEAKLIRLLPPPPMMQGVGTTSTSN